MARRLTHVSSRKIPPKVPKHLAKLTTIALKTWIFAG